jgi:hypothetical protein
VLDVPPTLSARVRLLGSGATDKTDPHDARAAAVVALRHDRLRQVTPVDHRMVLRLLADRHHDLTGLRTQAICRLHALLAGLIPGGAGRLLSARRADQILPTIHPDEPVATERKRLGLELLSDVRRFDNQLIATNERIVEAVLASGTTAACGELVPWGGRRGGGGGGGGASAPTPPPSPLRLERTKRAHTTPADATTAARRYASL